MAPLQDCIPRLRFLHKRHGLLPLSSLCAGPGTSSTKPTPKKYAGRFGSLSHHLDGNKQEHTYIYIYIYMIYFKTPRFRCRIFWIFLLSFYRQDLKPGTTPKNRLEDIVSKNTIHDVPKWSKVMMQQKKYSLIWNMFRLKCSIWKGFWGPFFYLYVRAE